MLSELGVGKVGSPLTVRLLSAHTKRISDPVYVVKPRRRDQRDLQNAAVIESNRSQTLVIVSIDPGCVAGYLRHVVKHYPILLRDRRSLVVFLQCPHQLFIQRDSTQKLCV
jgi:hypothetical protein